MGWAVGKAAGRWGQEGGETGKWRDGKCAPGPGNGLSKGKEAGRSPVCLWDGAGRELGSNQAEGVAQAGEQGLMRQEVRPRAGLWHLQRPERLWGLGD